MCARTTQEVKKTPTVPACFKSIAAPPGCCERKEVTSYTLEVNTIQHDLLLLCFATSAPSNDAMTFDVEVKTIDGLY